MQAVPEVVVVGGGDECVVVGGAEVWVVVGGGEAWVVVGGAELWVVVGAGAGGDVEACAVLAGGFWEVVLAALTTGAEVAIVVCLAELTGFPAWV